MKLASLRNGHPDGALVVVSTDLAWCTPAESVAATMLEAIENWPAAEPRLRALAQRLESGGADAMPFEPAAALSPLPRPRQWLDASAFPNHGRLMAQAFKLEPVAADWPLMYQGFSDHTLAPQDPVFLPSEEDGIDFEGEFGVIIDEVPMGVSAAAALGHVKLLLLLNDWSLRSYGPVEMRAGFGFIRAKPATAFAPVAITPDDLGDAWAAGRVALDLHVWRDGVAVGRPNGREMAFDFGQLIAHAAYSRRLSAGTILGSGTVSNCAFKDVGSTCIAEQRGIETIDNGAPQTPFLRFGERVRMEARDRSGVSVFGALDQQVLQEVRR